MQKATKKSRKQRARERRELTHDSRMEVSSGALRHFEEMMDPTLRDIAEVKYQHLVADPDHGELVGVPLSLGGVPPTSVKVRMKLAKTMISSPQGEVAIGFYNCSGPPDNPVIDTFGDTALEILHSVGNTMPKIATRDIGGVQTPGYEPPLVIGGYWATLPEVGGSAAPPLVQSNALTVPNPGLDLLGGTGRLVAQEVEIYPVGPMLTTEGLGYTVILNETSSESLNGRNAQDAFSLQNTQRHSFPLANWDSNNIIRAVRVPMAQSDVNLIKTDYTFLPQQPTPVQPSYLNSGEFWGGFFATGTAPNQPFRVETTLVYEFSSSQYAFATSNSSTSGSGTEILAPIKEHLPGGVYSREHKHANIAGAMAHTMSDNHGPKHAAGFASFLSKAGGVLGDVAKEVVPSLLGAALSAATDGVVPPSIGAGLGREAFTIANSFSGAPREPMGQVPLLTASPTIPQIAETPRIEVMDFAVTPKSKESDWVVETEKGFVKIDPDVKLSTSSGSTPVESKGEPSPCTSCPKCRQCQRTTDIEDII